MDLLQNIHIRILNQNDFQIFKMFHVEHFKNYPISDTSFESYLTLSQYKTAGAFLGNNLIGYIIYLASDYEADIVYIAIDPEYRRMGIATALLNAKCSTWNICKNIRYKIFLEVGVKNKAAVMFYFSQGFKIISLRKNYFPNEDAYLMTKIIN